MRKLQFHTVVEVVTTIILGLLLIASCTFIYSKEYNKIDNTELTYYNTYNEATIIDSLYIKENLFPKQKNNTCVPYSIFNASRVIGRDDIEFNFICSELGTNVVGTYKDDIIDFCDRYTDYELHSNLSDELIDKIVNNNSVLILGVDSSKYYNEEHTGKHCITCVGKTEDTYICIDSNFDRLIQVPKSVLENSCDFIIEVSNIYSSMKFDFKLNA